jgi:hypothetical protein
MDYPSDYKTCDVSVLAWTAILLNTAPKGEHYRLRWRGNILRIVRGDYAYSNRDTTGARYAPKFKESMGKL